jgi:hypothetical protein
MSDPNPTPIDPLDGVKPPVKPDDASVQSGGHGNFPPPPPTP